jgi:hypothetical protein
MKVIGPHRVNSDMGPVTDLPIFLAIATKCAEVNQTLSSFDISVVIYQEWAADAESLFPCQAQRLALPETTDDLDG